MHKNLLPNTVTDTEVSLHLLIVILPLVFVDFELKILSYHVLTGWENLNAEIVFENKEVYSRW